MSLPGPRMSGSVPGGSTAEDRPSVRPQSPRSVSSEERELVAESNVNSPALSESQPNATVPRKRRRIPRACDDCRRKKIKCDGKQPCSSCADFNSLCTYDRPVIRGAATANAPPANANKNVDVLEKKLLAAESVIRRFLPQLDLGSPEAVAAARLPQDTSRSQPERQQAAAQDSAPTGAAASDARIPLIGSADQLDLTDSGEYQFHGYSSGAAFLSRITKQFPGLLRHDSRMPFLTQPQRPLLASPLELSLHLHNPFGQPDYDYSRLPPQGLARDLCEYAFSRGSCLLRVIHAPSFWKMFDMLYKERPQNDANQERRFVGLLFSVIALGSMYDVDENDPTNPDHYAVAMERGYKYYTSARLYLQDLTECSDSTTLQALVFIIQFLQSLGNLNGCHTFIGIALRSALRMGFHRHLPHTPMNPVKDETRRRVFHTIRQMDIYLSTTLGLPLMLQDRDIDQPWPSEVDDEYITERGILQPPRGTSSFLEAFNAHTKLMRILADVVEHLYPPKGADRGPADVTYMISYARVREMEKELHDWHEQLSPNWRPGPETDTQVTRVKILLRFAYAHVQLMLYRPFLQYYSRQTSADGTRDERYFALAATGINVCRNIIHIGLEIQRQAVLIGPYWFITYTQFFAILSLVLYVLYNPDKPGSSELFADARLGKDCISGMTQRSLAADRVTVALNSFFEQLPERLRRADPGTSRRDPMSTPATHPSGQTHPMANVPRRPAHSNEASPQEQQWQLPSRSHSKGPNPPIQTPMHHQSASPTIPPPPVQYHNNGGFMDFALEDPFAYPLLPGVSLAGGGEFPNFEEDSLRLPVYDLHTDMEGQLLQLQDPLHASLFPMPTPAHPQAGRPGQHGQPRAPADPHQHHQHDGRNPWEPSGYRGFSS